MPNVTDMLQRTLNNYVRISEMLTEVVVNPTQANIDTLLTTAEGMGIITPKPTYSVDGVSYNWESYAESVQRQIEKTQKNIVLLGGCYITRSRGAV